VRISLGFPQTLRRRQTTSARFRWKAPTGHETPDQGELPVVPLYEARLLQPDVSLSLKIRARYIQAA